MWKTVWRFLKKLKIKLPYDPEIPFLGLYLKENETPMKKYTYTPMFIAVLFTTAKIQKQTKCPVTDEWIKKWCVCIHVHIYTMKYYSSIKKEQNFAICTNKDGLMLSEINQTERQILSDITYMWSLKNMTNVSITKEADLQIYRTNEWLPVVGGNIEAREDVR